MAKVQEITKLELLRLWIDDGHGIQFKVEVTEGKPQFTQVDGHKAITDFSREQIEKYVGCLCAMLNRYNLNP